MQSADKLIPPNPSTVTVIRAVTPNIVTLSAPFSRYGLMKVGGRGTIGTCARCSNATLMANNDI